MQLKDYYIAKGDAENGFIHLELAFIEGRSEQIKTELGNQFLATLKNHFITPDDNERIQISVEILDIKRSNYFKFPSGTL